MQTRHEKELAPGPLSSSCRIRPRGRANYVLPRILNHASGSFAGVAGIYNRFGYLAEMRQALLLWDQHVAALIGTKQPVLVDAVPT